MITNTVTTSFCLPFSKACFLLLLSSASFMDTSAWWHHAQHSNWNTKGGLTLYDGLYLWWLLL